MAEDSSVSEHGVPFIRADATEDVRTYNVDMPHVTQDLLARGTTYSPRPVFGNLLGGRRDLSFGIYGRADEARRLLDEKWSGESLPGKMFSTLLGDDRTKTDAGTKWGHHLLQDQKRLVSSIATSDALWAVLMCYNSTAESMGCASFALRLGTTAFCGKQMIALRHSSLVGLYSEAAQTCVPWYTAERVAASSGAEAESACRTCPEIIIRNPDICDDIVDNAAQLELAVMASPVPCSMH